MNQTELIRVLPGVCSRCGKYIKGKRLLVIPPNVERSFRAVDKVYHPACARKEGIHAND